MVPNSNKFTMKERQKTKESKEKEETVQKNYVLNHLMWSKSKQ